jgi:hypothetical protein
LFPKKLNNPPPKNRRGFARRLFVNLNNLTI